jgi:hypothetical protein
MCGVGHQGHVWDGGVVQKRVFFLIDLTAFEVIQ